MHVSLFNVLYLLLCVSRHRLGSTETTRASVWSFSAFAVDMFGTEAVRAVRRIFRGYDEDEEAPGETTEKRLEDLSLEIENVKSAVAELQAEVRGQQEVIAELGERLHAVTISPLESLRVTELKEMLRAKGLPVSGLKSDLVRRLKETHK